MPIDANKFRLFINILAKINHGVVNLKKYIYIK